MVLDSDGGTLVVADLTTDETVVVRFDATGTLDDGFAGGAGRLVLNDDPYDGARGMVAREDEVFVATGLYDTDVHEFGWSGSGHRVLTSLRDMNTNGLAVDASGLWFAGGQIGISSEEDARVVRIDFTGALDPGFGDGGTWEPVAPGILQVHAVLPLEDGRSIVTGLIQREDGPRTAAVWRLDASGQTDLDFGDEGLVELAGISPQAPLGLAWRVTVRPDGRIVVLLTCGCTWPSLVQLHP